jgi:hypothetical protein
VFSVDTKKGDRTVNLMIKGKLILNILAAMLAETGALIRGAADGDLDKRANAAIFLGCWNELVVGVNQIYGRQVARRPRCMAEQWCI